MTPQKPNAIIYTKLTDETLDCWHMIIFSWQNEQSISPSPENYITITQLRLT